ncbi:hypothetical protein MASR1M65_28420 [Saprospiraceae bacterium]
MCGGPDILEINGKFTATGDDSWSNDTLNKQTQYLYRFDQSLDTIERIHIPVQPKGWVQYGINLLHFEKENLIVTLSLKQNLDDKNAKDSLNVSAVNENDEIIWSYSYKPKNYNIRAVGSIVKNSDTSFVVSTRGPGQYPVLQHEHQRENYWGIY